jgi:hypothetical protein
MSELAKPIQNQHENHQLQQNRQTQVEVGRRRLSLLK